MRLRETKVSLPYGEGTIAANYPYIFPLIVAKGIKELELNEEEYQAFIVAFFQELLDQDIASGEVTLAGLKVKRIS